MAKSPIIVAIDTPDVSEAKSLALMLHKNVAAIKLGLEFFTKNGSEGVKVVTDNGEIPFFLDLKFHDIPNTVAGAVSSAISLSPKILTIHTLGGAEMIKAALNAAGSHTLIAGVTVLTSMSNENLVEVGINQTAAQQVLKLARMGTQAGLKALVCSPHEIEIIKSEIPEVKLIVPGIRPEGSENGDQKRIMTPKEAMNQGADYLVIGRPITASSKPEQFLEDILNSL